MKFNIIDKREWQRKEYFEHYYSNVPCTYSMTVEVDITNILEELKINGLKLYPFMIYCISKIVNRHREFRTAIDDKNNIGYYDVMNPSFTIFHKDTETFSTIWTEYNNDFKVFYNNYVEDMEQFGDAKGIVSKPIKEENMFTISSIPWTTFKGFNLNLQKGYDYLLPIFTIGKYYNQYEKILMPLSVQVHHSVCDGFHVSRFINELQDLIMEFKI